MNSIHMKVGFITPEKRIDIGAEHLLAFCGLACQKYLKEHPQEIEVWKEFSKDYSYFHPFFDFLVFHLKWIPVGILGDKELFGILEKDKLFLQHLPEISDEDDLYSTLFYTKVQQPDSKYYIVKADNHTLGIPYSNHKLKGEGIILQDGTVFLQQDAHQFAMARTILNQLMLKNPFLTEDAEICRPNYKDDYHWYLIDRLGAILFTDDYAMYDKNLLSEKQKSILELLPIDQEEQKTVQEEYENPYELESTKEIINKIY